MPRIQTRRPSPRALALLLALLCSVTGLASVATTASAAATTSEARAAFSPCAPVTPGGA